jgi:hypothetical protein
MLSDLSGNTIHIYVVCGAATHYHGSMARLARVVVPGVPHHVTQRGNRHLPTFFTEEDYAAYLAEGLDAEQAEVLRRHERTGRPLGSAAFLKRLEARLGRSLRKKPPGRKPKTKKK